MNDEKDDLQGPRPRPPCLEEPPTKEAPPLSGRSRRLIYGGQGGERLDRFLTARFDDLTRSQIKRLIDSGLVLLNGQEAKAGTFLRHGDVLTLTVPPSPPPAFQPEAIPLEIIYEDPWILVLNKPAGMVVHPAPGHGSGTLVNALLGHCPGIHTVGGPQRAGLIHRLDKGTSGVMVVAKTEKAHAHLTRQFKDRTVNKEYVTLVHGILREASGTINLPLGRDVVDRKRISPRTRKPRMAITHWRVLKCFPHYTLLRIMPETGRTHQIRVHLAAIKHPVVGDPTYGKRTQVREVPQKNVGRMLRGVRRQFLHAERLCFQHPERKVNCTFRAALPLDLIEILRFLGLKQQEIFDISHAFHL